MNDDDLDRLLGTLPFADAEETVDAARLAEWRRTEEGEIGEALIRSAAARSQLETLDVEEDEVGVARLQRAVFLKARRAWVWGVGLSALAAAAAAVFLLSRPTPPDYHPPALSGGTAEVRSSDSVQGQVYPPSGRVVLLLRPKQALAKAPQVAVYAADGAVLADVGGDVRQLEDGIVEVRVEVSALPGRGDRQVTLLTVLGEDIEGLAGRSVADARSTGGWQVFSSVVAVQGETDAQP